MTVTLSRPASPRLRTELDVARRAEHVAAMLEADRMRARVQRMFAGLRRSA